MQTGKTAADAIDAMAYAVSLVKDPLQVAAAALDNLKAVLGEQDMALKGFGKDDKKKPDYAEHLKTKPVTGIVSSSKAVKGEVIAETKSETEVLNPGVFSNGMAITVEGGRVMNLGNYETARIGVSITVPCDKSTLEDAYTYATEWVSGKINEAVALAKE